MIPDAKSDISPATFPIEGMRKLITHGWIPDIRAAAALLLLVAFVWCAGWNMWTIQDWNDPTAYLEVRQSDVIGMLAAFKTARDGHQNPLSQKTVPELGAPGQADWTSIPTIEELPLYLTGVLARITGLFAALNIKLLFGHLLAALTFYLVARYNQCAIAWAFLGGLAYGLAPFIFSESPHHSVVAYVWHIPLFLVVWKWISTPPGITPLSGKFWFAIVLAFITGLQNIYYTNIFCQITLLGGILLFLRQRSKPALVSTFAVIGGSAAAFVLMNIDTWIYQLSHERTAFAIERQFRWLEIYALKLSDLFIPLSTHQSPAFRNFSLAHAQQIVLSNEGSYLGLLGIASLLFVIGIAAYRVIFRSPKTVAAEAWQILWIFIVFTTGGLNAIAGIFGLTFFRAGYRLSIVVLAIALLFTMQVASKYFAGQRTLGHLIVVALTLIVIWDQMPLAPSGHEKALRSLQVESDRSFSLAMEDALPPGAMIFQLPVMSFPEAPVAGLTPYEHFRPYLYTNHLRYSFGLTKEALQSSWQSQLVNLPLGEAIQLLKDRGFGAVYLNCNGFPDHGKAILAGLVEAGLTEKIESKAGDLVCVLIN
jgi:phosphoglycerol transferase